MKTKKQQHTYAVLGCLTVILLLAAQYMSQMTLERATAELTAAKTNRDTMRQDMQARTDLVSRYKTLESSISSSGRDQYTYPENANALYAAVNNIFRTNQVEHTNLSSSSNTVPGGILELRLNFNGPYYGVLRALGSVRESGILMKIASLSIDAASDVAVTGTVTILSIAAGS